MKYRPEFPTRPFENLDQARTWLVWFIKWYNSEHLHSGIKFTTPADRHGGKDIEILENRKLFYQNAKQQNPNRWSKNIRNWNRIELVSLNQLKITQEDDMKIAA